ncbi:MAG: hypothetical protein HZA93_20440 [Verrucomicrobia bacterium]|nr:hypothetical protein [Verrucomicrobiota bacterium]
MQGPLKAASDKAGFATIDVVNSAREYFPQAEIVYSGWKSAAPAPEVTRRVDHVVLSDDPGTVVLGRSVAGPNVENTNRQIVSTVEGLKAATGDVVIKLRSDTKILNARLAGLLQPRPKPEMFAQPLVACSHFTRLHFFEYGGEHRCVGHLSDLFFCGRKEDVLRYWDGPLVAPHHDELLSYVRRPTAEQVLFVRFLRNSGRVPPDTDIRDKYADALPGMDFETYVGFLRRHFVVATPHALGIALPPRFARRGFSRYVFETESSLRSRAGESGRLAQLSYAAMNRLIRGEYRARRAAKRVLHTLKLRKSSE